MRELIGEHRRDAERHGGRDAISLERLERFDQRQVTVERGFAQPHTPVRPAAMVQDVGQMTVECQDEIHGRPSDGR